MAATLLMAGPAVAGYAATGDGIARGNYLVGTGTLGQFGTPTAYLGAYETNSGPLGGFTITYPDGTYAAGRVTCLTVTGNIAFLTGKIALSGGPRKETNRWLKDYSVVIGVEDNGNGGAAEAPDRLNFSLGSPTDRGCGWNIAAQPVFIIVKGNYRMADASA
ncbi:hypothetical protein [Allorhizocola rhizosphaerae]|uniref:hypothetical protein n=1 Tax=Allorhizocola rhizosphaerae TaxID=1872709 RepID=UPI000E3E5DB3|nr:hypothetical protein [Allorhizocola rhizosphaerae]